MGPENKPNEHSSRPEITDSLTKVDGNQRVLLISKSRGQDKHLVKYNFLQWEVLWSIQWYSLCCAYMFPKSCQLCNYALLITSFKI